MSEIIDLDARRAARAEVNGGVKQVKLGGEVFDLPAELPIAFAESLIEGDFSKAYASLVGADSVERFAATNPSTEDFTEIAQLYGMNLPESSPSTGSSATTGSPSRRTSRGSTTVGSRKRSTG